MSISKVWHKPWWIWWKLPPEIPNYNLGFCPLGFIRTTPLITSPSKRMHLKKKKSPLWLIHCQGIKKSQIFPCWWRQNLLHSRHSHTEHPTLCTLGAHRSYLVINSVCQLNSLCCDYKESRQQVRVAFTIFMQCDQSFLCPEPSAQWYNALCLTLPSGALPNTLNCPLAHCARHTA